jgi:DNA replication and repair protein RecF
VQVRRLALTGFRSYPALELFLGGGPQVVYGANAAGKTNLLESIVVLGLGHSHRATADADLIGWDVPFARLEAEVARTPASTSTVLELVLARSGGTAQRKRIRVNGVPRRTTALSAAFRIVLFAPEEMLLVIGSPSLRRGAVDTLATQTSATHARSLSTYSRALQQRNTLLRLVRDGTAERDQLGYWDEVIASEGGAIVAERLSVLDRLAAPLAAAHAEIAPGEGRLNLGYVTNSPTVGDETPTDALRRRLGETAEKELWNGVTLVGPHRDDLSFALDGRELAGHASRGQQRTAILALKLAHVDLLTALDGAPPLLLLDDVFSELDPARRGHLVRRIEELPQTIITTTALEDLDAALVSRSATWRVDPGSVQPGEEGRSA